MNHPFKVSTGLKDVIGRELITDDFVAVFELVKNSFDAHAKTVKLLFEEDRIIIKDNGKGMSRKDIINKWLFVAYSAKKEGTEDDDYREEVADRVRAYAGAKGVGRFSCDRLGRKLSLSSRAKNQHVQILDIDWTLYEANAKQEFGEIAFDLKEDSSFPPSSGISKERTGTVLEIKELRSRWDRNKLLSLKRELAKLINPFEGKNNSFAIYLFAPAHKAVDQEGTEFPVNGKVENKILDALKERTTAINIRVVENGETIDTTLQDRGAKIYQIKEANKYKKLKHVGLKADIYYLNKSAKNVFTRRMGIRNVAFGSIFLFRNGFRVFPIGQENDDFFGLARRKQQGTRRFLGGRDVIGRVDIRGVEGFDETTSRDGLIHTPEVDELIECILEKCIKRLERYVVDITWKDQFDKDVGDISRMKIDENSALIGQLVSRLAATEGVEIVEYDSELVRIIDDKSAAFESSLEALGILAEKTGDRALLARVAEATARLNELQEAEAAAREAEQRAKEQAAKAEQAATAAESRYTEERERNRFLVAASTLDNDTILNLHHQILMHASDVHLGVKRMMGKIRKNTPIRKEDWIDFLERISFRNSQILTASRFATKGGYKQQTAELIEDISSYIVDYVTNMSPLWAPRGISIEIKHDDGELVCAFRPIDVGIIIDNLITNAVKAKASKIIFLLEVKKGQKPVLSITVADDGVGWPEHLESAERVLEKGVTTTNGSGLGLYHVKQVVEGLNGHIHIDPSPYSEELCGAKLILRIPS